MNPLLEADEGTAVPIRTSQILALAASTATVCLEHSDSARRLSCSRIQIHCRWITLSLQGGQLNDNLLLILTRWFLKAPSRDFFLHLVPSRGGHRQRRSSRSTLSNIPGRGVRRMPR